MHGRDTRNIPWVCIPSVRFSPRDWGWRALSDSWGEHDKPRLANTHIYIFCMTSPVASRHVASVYVKVNQSLNTISFLLTLLWEYRDIVCEKYVCTVQYAFLRSVQNTLQNDKPVFSIRRRQDMWTEVAGHERSHIVTAPWLMSLL